MIRTVRLWLGLSLAALALSAVVATLWNMNAVSQVTVTLKPGADEPRDKAVLGIGVEHILPDYALTLVASDGRRIRLGTKQDRSASSPLTWEVAQPLNRSHAQSLILVDEDKLGDDVLEQVPIAGKTMIGNRYVFSIETTRTLHAGLEYFFDTRLGQAIAAGIAAAVCLLIVATFNG